MSSEFKLNIHADNAAFQNGNVDREIAKILREVASRIERGDSYHTFRNLYDSNGNIVGTFALKKGRQ